MEKINTSRRAPFGSNPKVGDAGRATQQRILAAASETFAAHGYTQTSVEAITDRAGCSRPTFYQYFSGKEDIHRRLAGRLGAELSELAGRIGPITADAAGRAALHDWLRELTGIHERYRSVGHTFEASLRTDRRMATGAADLGAGYRRALHDAVAPAAGDLADLDAIAGAANVTAYGACIYRDRMGDVDPDRLTAALADTLHRTFFGPRPGINLGPKVPPAPRPPAPEPDPEPPVDNRSRRTRGMETRRRLLDAALTAYDMLGFAAVRVDDIATEAGMSHGTFYRYFRDKDAIFDEHLGVTSRAIGALLAELPLAPGEEQRWAGAYFAHYERHGAIIGCLPEARAAGAAGALRASNDTAAALAAALDARDFGDVDADVVTCFSLLERVPAAAYGYAGLSVPEATAATARLLALGMFGHPLPT